VDSSSIIIFAHPHKSASVKTKQGVQWLQGFSFVVHYIEEGDRTPPPLKGYGQALKRETASLVLM